MALAGFKTFLGNLLESFKTRALSNFHVARSMVDDGTIKKATSKIRLSDSAVTPNYLDANVSNISESRGWLAREIREVRADKTLTKQQRAAKAKALLKETELKTSSYSWPATPQSNRKHIQVGEPLNFNRDIRRAERGQKLAAKARANQKLDAFQGMLETRAYWSQGINRAASTAGLGAIGGAAKGAYESTIGPDSENRGMFSSIAGGAFKGAVYGGMAGAGFHLMRGGKLDVNTRLNPRLPAKKLTLFQHGLNDVDLSNMNLPGKLDPVARQREIKYYKRANRYDKAKRARDAKEARDAAKAAASARKAARQAKKRKKP